MTEKLSNNDIIKFEKMAVEEDPFYLLENGFLFIKTKKGELIRLVLNFTQKYILKIIKEMWYKGEPIRLLILKARQEGVSTMLVAFIYSIMSTQSNRNAVLLADDIDGTDYLFEMAKIYYEKMESHLKPEIKKSNRKILEFKDIHSLINVHTANEPDAVRKYTYQLALLSEFALYPYPKDLMLAISQTIPMMPKTMAVLETTAKGKGKKSMVKGKKGAGSTYFYKEWQKVKKGESDWRNIFIPWYWHEEYSTPIYEDAERIELENSLDEDEKGLRKIINERTNDFITLEQIKWRRWIIRNNCQGDVENFRQEYPSNEEEAWISGGRPRFSITALREMSKRTLTPRVGDLKWENDRIVFNASDKGRFKIAEEPLEDEQYVIGADVGGGKEEGDPSVVVILSARTFREVAQWWGFIEPELFGYELNKIGLYYNIAMVDVESNNHGLTALMSLKNLNYPNIAHQMSFKSGEPQETKQIGWTTNRYTKYLMFNFLATVIWERSLLLSFEDTIDELMDFGEDLEAMSGRDDIVVALAIAVEGWRLNPYLRRVRSRPDTNEPIYALIRNRQNNLDVVVGGGNKSRCGYG